MPSPKKSLKLKPKPTLVRVGRHFLDPLDIASIKETLKGLYVIKLKSEPNAKWPIWIQEKDIQALLKHFNIVEED